LKQRLDREIRALALPALGALAADPLVSMVDTAFVGRLGVLPLAALGINASVFSLAFVIFNFLAYATTPAIARAVGRGAPDEAGQVAVHALTLALLAGTGALVLLQLLADPILALMGASGDLREPAGTYLRIRALAGPAVLFMIAGHGIFRGWQDTRTPLWLTLAMNLINLVLDPLLIFGLGWGLAGAALATTVAQWAGALLFAWAIFGPRRTQLHVRAHVPSWRDLLPLVRVGGALGVRTLSLVGTMTLATAVAARLGAIEVAAHQIAVQLWLLLALVVDALAVAGQAMVARYRDAGPSQGVTARAAADRLLQWGLATGVALAVLFFVASPWLPYLFTDAPAVVQMTMVVLPFVIAMQPLNALVFVWDGIFIGAEAFGSLARQMLLAAFLASTVLLAVGLMGGGLMGVWWGIVTLMLVRAATLAWAYWGPRSGCLLGRAEASS
jgi:putative MATE family efflux protein